MSELKTRSIRNLEERMEDIDPSGMRYQVCESAKEFKTSWLALGQALYTVWKDKLYREWGYQDFEVYTKKEIGIRKETALKLLRSYAFIEKEEPRYLKQGYTEQKDAARIPTYEAVDVARRASSNKNLEKADIASLKKKVLQEGGDSRAVAKEVTQLIREREELSPDEARAKKRTLLLRRFLSTLKSIRREIDLAKVLPAQVAKDLEGVICAVETAAGVALGKD